ncbi:MAG TPA: hypothetical protein VM686_28190 [Polyangiaceae bacterium]|nr:hypothetical protein [Polyangiaceae bacterium]
MSGVLACEGGEDDELGFCASLCSRVSACAVGSSDSCMQGCDQFRLTTSVSEAFLDAMAPCVAGSSCRDIATDAYLAACWDEATVGFEPSSAVVDSCMEISANEFACGLDADVGSCVDNLKAYEPEFVGSVVFCSRLSCAELVTCYMELSE